LGEGINQVALAEEIGIEGPSLVRVIDQLATDGLVRRKKTKWIAVPTLCGLPRRAGR
jgi:MarR family transcriptional regulator for hemolysin